MSEQLKIALIGSAPGSVRLAPYADPTWQIWGCSPGVYGVAPRVDLWFELHRFEPGQPWFSPEYCQWMAKAKFPVMMAEVRAEIPTSVRTPQEHLIAKYDPEQWFWTSTLSWMMAVALETIVTKYGGEDALRKLPQGTAKIGFWGVDMAASEEYEAQRAGIHFFAKIAKSLGIEVGAPPESDLFTPRFLYGVDEIKHSSIKILARKRELTMRRDAALAEANSKAQEAAFLSGALDDIKYMGGTWASKVDQTGPLMPKPLVAQPAEPVPLPTLEAMAPLPFTQSMNGAAHPQ